MVTQLQQGEEKGAASVVGNRIKTTNRIIFVLSPPPPSSHMCYHTPYIHI